MIGYYIELAIRVVIVGWMIREVIKLSKQRYEYKAKWESVLPLVERAIQHYERSSTIGNTQASYNASLSMLESTAFHYARFTKLQKDAGKDVQE